MIRDSKFLIAIIASLLITCTAEAKPQLVSDELVSGLQCSNLDVQNIYMAIKPSAFNRRRQVMTRNFETSDGLGHCWAIARWQRIALLLGRANGSSQSTAKIAGMVRGLKPNFRNTIHFDLIAEIKNYSVFSWPTPLSRDNQVLVEASMRSLEAELQRKKIENGSSNYREELMTSQRHLFFRVGNVAYLGATQPQSEKAKVALAIKRLALAKKLPLINLRVDRFGQHVVVVRDVKLIDKLTLMFSTIDSNHPDREHYVFFRQSGQTGEFYSGERPSIANARKLDVFLVGEDERKRLDSALLTHYRRLCASNER